MSPLLALPAIDGVEITTIMDNSLDLLMSSTPVARRFPLPHYGFIRNQLRAEHGVSLLITIIDQGTRETILFDTGVTPDGALHNLAVLGIDLSTIQAIVLSHGHTDHTHGLDGFLAKLGTRRMPILLHPDAFLKRRIVYNDTSVLDLPPPSLHDLEREGIELVAERGPSFLINGKLLVTGQIERTTDFEQGLKNQQAEIDGTWQPDPWVYDDQAIVMHVRNKGLVVATGCGHAGVINILQQVRAQQANEAARLLGVERLSFGLHDRFLADTMETRLQVARLLREHRPRWVYSIGEACVHPDHAAVVGLTRAAVFLARLGQWERVPGGEMLAGQEPLVVERLFFPHCKMEPPWTDFAFAVDVSKVYERKRQALAAYQSIFLEQDDRLLALYEAEDQYYRRLLGVTYAEIFRSAAPLLVEDPTVFSPVSQG